MPNFKWCLVCAGYFPIIDNQPHECTLNMDTNVQLCQNNVVSIDERGTVLFYCSYCSRTTKMNQQVCCKVRGNAYKEELQIPRPYFCRDLNCEFHPNFQDVFCDKHPKFKEAVIIEYGHHIFDESSKCSLCRRDSSIAEYAPYCNENTNIENLASYLSKFPLLPYKRTHNSPNVVRNIRAFKVKVRAIV